MNSVDQLQIRPTKSVLKAYEIAFAEPSHFLICTGLGTCLFGLYNRIACSTPLARAENGPI